MANKTINRQFNCSRSDRSFEQIYSRWEIAFSWSYWTVRQI